MNVLVVGAYGLIGSAIANHLAQAGHNVIGLGRHLDQAHRKMPHIQWIAGDLSADLTPSIWEERLAGVDAVVHAAGILQDGAGDDVRAVQVLGTSALYEACERLQIRRVIHISAMGAVPQAETAFMATKAEADEALQQRDLDWVILKPGLVLARQAYGGTALLRGLAAAPLALPIAAKSGPIQIISVDDIALTVEKLLLPGAPRTGIWEMAHPTQYTLADIALRLRAWFGLAPASVVPVPNYFLRFFAHLGDAVAWLGWRNPLRSTALAQIEQGVVGDVASWQQEFDIKPLSLERTLTVHTSTVQDLWHSRLLFLKPIAIVTLVLFWFLSGLITLGPAYAEGVARFQAVGLSAFGPWLTIGGGLLDIALALLLAWRKTAFWALGVMALVSLGYLLCATILMPALWSDPLGPLLKIFPILVLTGMVAAILPSR